MSIPLPSDYSDYWVTERSNYLVYFTSS